MKSLLAILLIAYAISDCPNIVKKGSPQNGFTTRYWDCCKPSCSWNNGARSCDASQNVLGDVNAKSTCDGGPAGTCLSQIPFMIGGCDMGFAFAATPGSNGGNANCGKCFLLTFNGEGHWKTTPQTQALKGKQLVVMATNIGYDVDPGQFDIMIPGGGVGLFNGCATLFGNANMGQQYGGLLSECNDVKHASDPVACLKEACQRAFSNVPQALQGCQFHIDFFQGADNPNMSFEEIECPDVLKSKY
jgi:hypothetical protein